MGRLDSGESSRMVMPVPLRVGLGVWMTALTVGAYLYVPPAMGFADPRSARIVVFHVPCALIAVIAYLVGTAYAVAYLVRRNAQSDAKSAASAGLGLLFTVLATGTGMIFARVQWGSAWNWDPRETSILMLMLVYAGYFALRSAVQDRCARARISAVYNIMACVVMPYLVFALPRLTKGLHPTTTLVSRSGLSLEYRIALAAGIVGFLWLYLWLFRLRVRVNELAEAKRRNRIEL